VTGRRTDSPVKWVTPTSRRDQSQPRMRLFCFAHAGGGTALFQPWRSALGPDIDVCPVLLPGRESRRRETPERRVEPLLEPLFDELLPLADRPYALFGHSMGTVLAFEMAQRFARRHWRQPSALLVSGRRPPHLPSRRPPYASLPDAEFLAAVASLNGTPDAMLESPDLLRLFLPALRADFELVEAYRPSGADVLSCPVEVLLATSDPEINRTEADEWARWTTGRFAVTKFPGDHFYLASGRRDVVSFVGGRLSPADTSPSLEFPKN